MNIRLVISNYKNQDGRSNILFDCSENTYRKKIDTGIKISNTSQITFRIRENELDNFSFETKILVNKLLNILLLNHGFKCLKSSFRVVKLSDIIDSNVGM